MEIFSKKPAFTSLILLLLTTFTFLSSASKRLNCSTQPDILPFCRGICNEDEKGLPYSSTFCDSHSGSCVCDCRDTLGTNCVEIPFTPCFQDCVAKNPNPDVYLYKGATCTVSVPHRYTPDAQCACECSLRDDYIETNDILDEKDFPALT